MGFFYYKRKSTDGWSPVKSDLRPTKKAEQTAPKIKGLIELTPAQNALTLDELVDLFPLPSET